MTRIDPAAAVAGYLRDFSDSIAVLPASEVVDLGHLRGVFTGRAMFNRFYDAVHPSRISDEDVERVRDLSRQRGVRPVWIVDRSSLNERIERALTEAGFQQSSEWTGMWRELRDVEVTAPPTGLEVRRVAGEADLRHFTAICHETEHCSAEQAGTFFDLFAALGAIQWRHLIAIWGGEPVATASMFVTGNIAALDWVNTLPRARKRGIAAHLVTRLLDEARSSCELAVLTSTSAGESVYRKLGFEECSRIVACRML